MKKHSLIKSNFIPVTLVDIFVLLPDLQPDSSAFQQGLSKLNPNLKSIEQEMRKLTLNQKEVRK